MRVIFIKRKILYIFLIIIIMLIITLSIISKRTRLASFIPTRNKVIGIDPGHGGIDPGAVGISGVKEDEINLKIALKLKKFIEQSGGKAVLTRETKEGLYTKKSKTLSEKKTEDLHKRKEIIENANCDVFVTIHLNSFQESRYYGAQTFYGLGNEEGKFLAICIQEELVDILDKNNHRVPQEREGVFLINELEMPSVLIECGFLSNPNEEQLLNTEGYQEKVAWAIYIGIMKYLNKDEGHTF